MNKLYKIRRQWQVPGWTEKHGGWVSITNSFYRYLSEDAGVHDPENSLEVFNTFRSYKTGSNFAKNLSINEDGSE